VLTNLYEGIRTFLKIDTNPEQRKYGFKDRCSRLMELKETMTLPKGYVMVQEPKQRAFRGNIASFEGSCLQQSNKLIVMQTLSLGKRVYEAEDWTDFRAAVNGYKEFANTTFVFEKR
jgi:hypothetical protein